MARSAGTDDKVAFNAGTLTSSFIMSAADWRQAAKPEEFSFGREA